MGIPYGFEILTSVGWIGLEEVTENTLIACLDNDIIEYHKPIKIECKELEQAQIYNLDSKYVNLYVESDTQLYVKKKNEDVFKLSLAKDILGIGCFYKDKYLKEIDGTINLIESLSVKKFTQNFDKILQHNIFYYLKVPNGIFCVRNSAYKLAVWIGE